MTYQLADHQKRILALMEDREYLGIFAEAGTGKTMIALTYIYNNIIAGAITNALVVCPSSLISSWRLAIERMREFGYDDFDVEIMKSYTYITSFRMLWKYMKRGGATVKVLRETVDKDWDVAFIDESHRLGDPKSAQTKMALKLALRCKRRFIMTGTPDNTHYVKLYGQMKFLKPDIWRSYREFDNCYIWSKNVFHKPIRYDVESLEQLKRTYGTVVRLRECFDMPDSIDIDVPVDLGAQSVYDDFISNNMADYGIDVKVAGMGTMKAVQVCSGFYLDDNHVVTRLKNNKLDAMMTILEGIEDKVVIFANYRESIDVICEQLTKSGISHYRYDGTVSEPVWQKFQNDDTKVIVVQFQRGSEGIDLFASNCTIYYETTLQACLLEQSKARTMRKGQTRHCRYYFLYSQGTIEEKMMRSVRKGVDVSRQMLDDWAIEERNKRNTGQ